MRCLRAENSCVYLLFLMLLVLPLVGCERPDPAVTIVATTIPFSLPPTSPVTRPADSVAAVGEVPVPPTSPVQDPAGAISAFQGDYVGTPTPDPPRPGSPGSGGGSSDNYQVHVVGVGETLGYLAQYYDVSLSELIEINGLAESDFLYLGQELRVPAGGSSAGLVGPSNKIIPNSELVYGPAAKAFDVAAFVNGYDSYLASYQLEVEGRLLSGPEVVQLVADRYSVNPRLLLAALEYRTGWVTEAAPFDNGYPMGRAVPGLEGLYWQLGWAADQLNWGFYGRAEGGVNSVLVGGVTQVAFAADINDGTAGVQYWLAADPAGSYDSWLVDVSPAGFYATYTQLFGNPFAYTVDPLWPANLSQPNWQLPWAAGETWYFTGGPHGGWASGSGWAALDFVPDDDGQLGCYPSEAWVTSMTGGVVSRSDFGAVVVDVDGDGFAGTGWAVTYMHLETRDRIPAGTVVQPGDRLGHPSCEGGFSNGTHVHISRTYNGRWVAADGSIPFMLGGWLSQGLGQEYDGLLVKGDMVKEACECREEINAIPAGE